MTFNDNSLAAECKYCGEIVYFKAETDTIPAYDQFSQNQPCHQYNIPLPIQSYGDKSKSTAAILCILLGGFGIHQFYLGNNTKGIIYLVVFIIGCMTCTLFWVTSIAALVDFVLILSMSTEDFNRKYNINN